MTGSDVGAIVVPYYEGGTQFVWRYASIRRTIREAISDSDAVLVRVPYQLADLIVRVLAPDRPFGLEVVGDPREVFSPGAWTHPGRPLFRVIATETLRRQCLSACAVSYVTKHQIQARYPASRGAITSSYSSIDLPDAWISEEPMRNNVSAEVFKIVSVMSLAQMYKAPDVLIKATEVLVRRGESVVVSIVGDGRHRRELELMADGLGVAGSVRFCGYITDRDRLRSILDQSDLFVLPSRTEGLPRAMIEAMARGLPCIGTDVGGIPELLSVSELVPKDDPLALAEAIQAIINDPERRCSISSRNTSKAREFTVSVLEKSRSEFYGHLRSRTEEWIRYRDAEGV
jgi:glycosyltransferase involved in cell wall biosynthesis